MSTALDPADLPVADGYHEDICEAPTETPCPLVALWRVTFRWTCHCWPEVLLYCDPHAQRVIDAGYRYGACTVCDKRAELISITPKGKA